MQLAFLALLFLTFVQNCAADRSAKLAKCLCFDRATNTGCTGVITDQCQDYVKSLVITLYPSIACAVIFLFLFPMFMLCRRCCNTCGGREPSDGICCPDKKSFTGYSSCERSTVKCLLLFFCVSVAVMSVVTFFRSSSVSDGVDDVTDVMMNMVHEVNNATDLALVEFDQLGDYISEADKQAIMDAAEVIRSASKDIENVKDDIDRYDRSKWYSRNNITIGFSVVAFLLFAVGGCMALCNVSMGVAQCAVTLFTSFGVTFCYVVAIYQVGSSFIDDVCDTYPDSTAQIFDRIESRLGCDPGDAGLNQIITQTRTAQATFSNDVCPEICSPQLFVCPNSCTPPQFDTMARILTESSPSNPGDSAFAPCDDPCTVQKCAEQCTAGSAPQVAASQVVQQLGQFLPVFETIEQVVFPVASCTFLTNFFTDMQEPFCNETGDPMYQLWQVTACIMFAILLGTFVLAIGSKRFSKAHSADRYEHLQAQKTLYGAPGRTYGTGPNVHQF
ncbi:hypothetical protein DIPPA_10449 [Diplonema papillatum]|nr:hypothetical protein DIPPA_10449 [Diplonema papillatum]